MSLVFIGLGVLLLLLLMVVFKLNAFISLIIVSLIVAVLEGMTPLEAIASVEKGLGSTLGHLALVLGFGAMLGKLMADSGGAQRITMTLIDRFGIGKIQWATMLTGFVIGIALFYETGFIILIPLVFTIAQAARLPVLYVGMPLVAALITTHGFLPPHPGPTAIANVFQANMGQTLLVGIILAIPAVLVGGLLFTKLFKKDQLHAHIPKNLFNPKEFTEEEMPSFGISIFTAVLPVLLMTFRAFLEIFFPSSPLLPTAEFLGEPAIALLISVLLAIYTFGLGRGKSMQEVMKSITDSIGSIAMILLIIAGGGAFKQVLIDSGVDQYIAGIMQGSTLSPLLLTWLIAAVLRVSLGSATVAGLTAAGISAPLIGLTGVSPELMVIATGAGSITFSHVNDAGFWIYKEYFNLSMAQTFKTWTLMVTVLSLVGLAGVLVADLFM